MKDARETPDGERVLVVESEPEARQLLAVLLCRAGYGVDQACDGDAALKALWRGGYGLIIMVDKTPFIDGRHLLAVSRNVLPQTPVVMISDKPPDSVESARRLGVYAWICKPFDGVNLLRIARKAMKATR